MNNILYTLKVILKCLIEIVITIFYWIFGIVLITLAVVMCFIFGLDTVEKFKQRFKID